MPKLQVKTALKRVGASRLNADVDTVECPDAGCRISIAHCNWKYCPSYRGRHEAYDPKAGHERFEILCNKA